MEIFMINYREFQELYKKLPRNRICQKQSWEVVSKALEKDDKRINMVLIARTPKQADIKNIWFTKDGILLYNFDVNKDEEYVKSESVTNLKELDLGATCQYSLSQLKIAQPLNKKNIELLFELHRQGKIPNKMPEAEVVKLLSSKKPSNDIEPKQRIIKLFINKLTEQTKLENNPQRLFHKAKENFLSQIGNDEHQHLFSAVAPTWEKLFCAFTSQNSIQKHVQFYTMHILPIFNEVKWPQEN